MLHTSMEKMAMYIGTKYGNEAAQEWTSGKNCPTRASLFAGNPC
jgi:hypothetical protein